jgi:PAS domain S-box-containing protein
MSVTSHRNGRSGHNKPSAGPPKDGRAAHRSSQDETPLAEELRQARAQLEALRARHAELQDQAPVGILTLDASDRILEANKTFAILLGVDRATLIGQPFPDHLLPEDRTLFARHRASLAEPAAAQVCELRMRRPDESRFWLRLDACLAANVDGSTVCRAWLTDITELKREEAARRLISGVMDRLSRTDDDESLARDLLQIITAGTDLDAAGIRLRADGHFPYLHTLGFTDAFVRQENDIRARTDTGEIARDHEGLPILECLCGAVLKPDHRPGLRDFTESGSFWCNALASFKDPRLAAAFRTRLRHRCYAEGHQSLALVPLRHRHTIIGLLQVAARRPNQLAPTLIRALEDAGLAMGMALSHKQSEEALREREAHLRSLTNNLVSGMVYQLVRRPDGARSFTYLSEAVQRLYGCTPQEGMANAGLIYGRVHPDDRGRVLREEEEANRTLSFFRTETRMLNPGGGVRWSSFVACPRLLEDGSTCWDGIEFDITERKRIEAELKKARDEAEAANRAKSEYLAVMSHELRTPLNPVLGFSELLAGAPNLVGEQRTWLEIVRQRGQDLLQLIGTVLDLSKIEAGKIALDPQPIPLRPLLKDMAASMAPTAQKKGLILEWQADSNLPETIMVDSFRLRQILLNLLTNAIKFTEYGQILLRVADGRAAPRTRDPAPDELALLFQVHDTGPGIAPERQAAIFEAFTHADAAHAGHGAGLGLAIAKRLAEAMGGSIWVESEPGRGSTFSFTCLVGGAATVFGPGPAEPEIQRDPVPLKILAVDDDVTSLLLLEELLAKSGHKVRTASDGPSALAAMEKESFDVVLLDIRMPGMDGVQVARLIRARELSGGSRTALLAVTACVSTSERDLCLAAGMDGFVPKPIQAARLFEAIQSCTANTG